MVYAMNLVRKTFLLVQSELARMNKAMPDLITVIMG